MSTVLLLQPDPQFVEIWRVALESSGHDVVTTFSARAGTAVTPSKTRAENGRKYGGKTAGIGRTGEDRSPRGMGKH